MNYILTIDVGSSFIKYALFEEGTETLRESFQDTFPPFLKLDDRRRKENDPEAVFMTLKLGIERALSGHEVSAIYIDTQMHGYILSDAFFSPLSNYVTWQDGLAEESYLKLKGELSQEQLCHMGTRYKTGLTACSLHARRGELRRIEGEIYLHTLAGYVFGRLAGSSPVTFCHETMAASLGLYDIETGDWDGDIVNKVCGSRVVLPRIIHGNGQATEYKGIPVYGDYGDHQASVYGCDGYDESSMVLTLGTAGILSTPSEKITYGEYETRPFFNGTYLNTVTRQPGGRTVDVVIDLFRASYSMLSGKEISRSDVWKKIERTESSGGLKIYPGYFLERPMGEISGIDGSNLTPGGLLYAGIKGMTDFLIDSIKQQCSIIPGIRKLIVSGGKLAHDPLVLKLLREGLELEIRESEKNDEALYGLARLAKENIR